MDVRDGWEVAVPSLSHLILLSSDPCCALLPGTWAHRDRSDCAPILAFLGPLLHAGGSGQGGLRLWCPTGAAWGPTSASQAPAADVVPAGCCPRAAGSAPCVSTGVWGARRILFPFPELLFPFPQHSAPSAAVVVPALLPTFACARMESRESPAQVLTKVVMPDALPSPRHESQRMQMATNLWAPCPALFPLHTTNPSRWR